MSEDQDLNEKKEQKGITLCFSPEVTKTGGKKGWRQKLRESEQRNVAAIQYIELLEKVHREVLVYAAECYDKLSIIVVPGMEFALKALEQICIATAPICQDAEDLYLPPGAEKILAEGGTGLTVRTIPKAKLDEEEEGNADGTKTAE